MKKILLLSSLLVSLNSFAGTLVCDGVVETVGYHGNNNLMFKLSSMNNYVFFCNPSAEWTVTGATGRTMNPETCKSLFSLFLTARSTKEAISKVHFDGDDVPSKCSEFGSMKKVFIRYVSY